MLVKNKTCVGTDIEFCKLSLKSKFELNCLTATLNIDMYNKIVILVSKLLHSSNNYVKFNLHK